MELLLFAAALAVVFAVAFVTTQTSGDSVNDTTSKTSNPSNSSDDSSPLSLRSLDDVTCKECGSGMMLDPRPVVARDEYGTGRPDGREEPNAPDRDSPLRETSQRRLHCNGCNRTAYVRENRLAKTVAPRRARKRVSARLDVQTAIQLSNSRQLSDFKGH